jgi:hypothetical protein
MKNQIIKNKIENFDEFIKSIGTQEDKYILIDENHYKKAEYKELITPFLLHITPYYYETKKRYLTRKMNYNSFITILRQISKKNEIVYESVMKYNNSKHYIEYHFYLDNI